MMLDQHIKPISSKHVKVLELDNQIRTITMGDLSIMNCVTTQLGYSLVNVSHLKATMFRVFDKYDISFYLRMWVISPH